MSQQQIVLTGEGVVCHWWELWVEYLSRDSIGLDILLEFLEVALHNILYVRNLYPKEIFIKKQVYGISVPISEHPELNAYLKEVLNSIGELIKNDDSSVKKITLSFYDDEKMPVEQFVFDFDKLKADFAVRDPFFLKTEEALRTYCLKLSMTGSYLQPLPKNATFSIQIHTDEAAHIALNENPKCENFPWIEAEEGSIEIKEQILLPIKTIDTEYMRLQMRIFARKNEGAFAACGLATRMPDTLGASLSCSTNDSRFICAQAIRWRNKYMIRLQDKIKNERK